MQTRKEPMNGQQAYSRLSALCARSEHCQQEMLDKMRQWGVADDEQAQVMARLVKEQYVDDARYARAFVNDKVRYDRWGRRKVETALRQKRIDAETCREVLDEVPPQDYVEALKPLLKQKRRSTKASSNYELNMKLIRYALSRGYEMDIIRQCIDVDDEDEFLD